MTLPHQAQIVDHETRDEGKRFTVYCIKLTIGDKEIQVFQRYSAFHELYVAPALSAASLAP